MTTLAELRSALRALLNDNAAEGYLWSDAALNLHIGDAARSYSRAFPREMAVTVTTVAGQAEYDLPADCARVVRVGFSEAHGHMPLVEGGDAFGEGYDVYGGRLVLMPPPSESGQSVEVRYLASHAAMASDGAISTVPEADEDLLLASSAARVLGTLSTEEAKRQRFEGRAGQTAISVADFYRRQYEEGVRERRTGVRARRLAVR